MVSLRPDSDSLLPEARSRERSSGCNDAEHPATVQSTDTISPTQSWRELAAAMEVEPNGSPLHQLSPAERVVVAYLCQGLSNKEIAQALGKSEFTVKHQVSACLTKLRVSSRTRLIALLR